MLYASTNPILKNHTTSFVNARYLLQGPPSMGMVGTSRWIYRRWHSLLEAVGRELGRNNYIFTDSLSTWISKSVSYGISESGCDSVSKILLHPWWKRVWVLQEVAVAKQVLVLCGNKETHLKNIAALMAVLATSNISRFNFYRYWLNVCRFVDLRHCVNWSCLNYFIL
jgi:hypothetical protein